MTEMNRSTESPARQGFPVSPRTSAETTNGNDKALLMTAEKLFPPGFSRLVFSHDPGFCHGIQFVRESSPSLSLRKWAFMKPPG